MKERLDILLVERRLVESRVKAQWLIKKGFVTVNKTVVIKPGKRIDNQSSINLTKKFPYVGRGGLKLEAALKDFSINAKGKICADIGASVGGFTDCLLQNGATKVYVIDTAKSLLHPSLKCKNEQVIELLGVDARKLKELPTKVDIATVDITFTSLKSILPNVQEFLKKEGDIIVLVKPLFETDFRKESNFKIINDLQILREILIDLVQWNVNNMLYPKGLIVSPLLGKGGSVEFLIHIRIDKEYRTTYVELIDKTLECLKEFKD